MIGTITLYCLVRYGVNECGTTAFTFEDADFTKINEDMLNRLAASLAQHFGYPSARITTISKEEYDQYSRALDKLGSSTTTMSVEEGGEVKWTI